jgi:hypothetical protein
VKGGSEFQAVSFEEWVQSWFTLRIVIVGVMCKDTRSGGNATEHDDQQIDDSTHCFCCTAALFLGLDLYLEEAAGGAKIQNFKFKM